MCTYTQHENQASRDKTECSNDLCRGTSREVRGRWLEVQHNICHSARQRKPNQHVTPLLVHHSRCHAGLVVRPHHHAKQHNDQGWHGVQGNTLRPRWCPGFIRGSMRRGLEDGVVDPVTDVTRFEKHTGLFYVSQTDSYKEREKKEVRSYQTATEEQYGNRNVLEICSRPRLTHTGEVLEENICRAI